MSVSTHAALKDGIYEIKVPGHNAPMTIKVTVKEGKIEAIGTKDIETLGVGKVALREKIKEILERQSLGIDAMSGATLSSFALLQGVEDCLKQAGADQKEIDKWTTNSVVYPTEPLTIQADVAVIGGGRGSFFRTC